MFLTGVSNVWASKTLYFNPGPWHDGTERYALYVFTGSTAGPWTSFTDEDGDGTYETTFDDSYESMIICRMNGGNNTNNWSNMINQTSDLSAARVNGLLYTITAAGEGWNTTALTIKITTKGIGDGGTFYIRNVATQKFWGAGNTWGTESSLVDEYQHVTLHLQSDGRYTVESMVSNGEGKIYYNGSYMDSDNAHWLDIETSGDYYKISDDGPNYLGYNGSTTVLANNLASDNANALWEFMTAANVTTDKAARVTAASSATAASPVDMTFLINDADFGRNRRDAYTAWTMVADNQNLNGGGEKGGCAESYHSTFTLSQTLSDVPNGVYKMTAQGFYRQDGEDNTNLPYFYINGGKQTFQTMGELYDYDGSKNNSMGDAAYAFSQGSYTISPIQIVVTDNTITLGAKLETNTNLWCIWDNIQLTYYGPVTELPDGGAMTADTWYYKDINAAGLYSVSATNLSNIVFTKDATAVDNTVSTTFSSVPGLQAARYYMKSSSANTLTIGDKLFSDNTVYYFKKNGEYQYLTRGGNYGTENVTDKFGLSFETKVQNDGTVCLKNVDHSLVAGKNLYLNEQYTDQEAAYKWTIESTTGGYLLKRANGRYVKTTEEGTWHYNYMSDTDNSANAIVWNILTATEYQASLTARKNAEAAAIATAANTEATTESELIAKLINATDKTSSISNASLADNANDWTAVSYESQRRNQSGEPAVDVIRFNSGGAEVWNYVGGAKQTISDLPAGIYKVTVKAVWRIADSNDAPKAADHDNVTAWMYATANDVNNYTQLKSWNDHNVANNAALHASTNDEYVNTVYVYVPEGEDLTIGIASPSWCGVPWMPFYDWTLTRYDATATVAQKSALAAAITAAENHTLGFDNGEYAPYVNVDALTKLAAAKDIDVATATNTAVVAATTALTGATWTANDGEVDAFYDGGFAVPEVDETSSSHNLNGWTSGDNFRQILGTVGTFAGLADASEGKAVFSWPGGGTYGSTDGYTMPLKANTIYKLKLKTAGWNNEDRSNIKVSVLKSSDGMATYNLGTPTKDIKGNETNTAGLDSYEVYFVTGAAGDYVFSISCDNGKNFVFTDLELKKADYLEFADGSVPSYAPGTYPSVKISRSLTANRWATAVYPFAVSGVDNIAVLESFNSTTGKLYFESADNSTANEPFLMRSTTEGGISEINLSNVAVAATTANPTVTEENNYVSLIGSYAPITVEAGGENKINYVLSNNSIYYIGSKSANINPYRAYIQLNSAASARSLSFFVDDEETTNIEGVTPAKEKLNGNVYNLNGQLVRQNADNMQGLRKGVYVVGGQRIVVK